MYRRRSYSAIHNSDGRIYFLFEGRGHLSCFVSIDIHGLTVYIYFVCFDASANLSGMI